jgi:hypothetical protein
MSNDWLRVSLQETDGYCSRSSVLTKNLNPLYGVVNHFDFKLVIMSTGRFRHTWTAGWRKDTTIDYVTAMIIVKMYNSNKLHSWPYSRIGFIALQCMYHLCQMYMRFVMTEELTNNYVKM